MKNFFTKLQKFPLRQSAKVAALSGSVALLLMAVLVRAVIPVPAQAYTIYPSMSYTPVATGGYTTISWSAPGAANCTLSHPQGTGTLPGEYCYSPSSCYITVYASSGSSSAGPMNSAVRYDLYCHNGTSSGTTNITVTPTSCASSNFGSPWNSNSYLIYSGGQGSISNWYGRYCLTNYSGSAIYIPMSTPTEWNDFVARASAIGIGIVSY